jgi:hypothetical protein
MTEMKAFLLIDAIISCTYQRYRYCAQMRAIRILRGDPKCDGGHSLLGAGGGHVGRKVLGWQ